jgi:short-subunit dehydrogenase
MIKALLERQIKREKRSAIMITSSGISHMPGLPGIQSYCCTKKCVSVFGESLFYELKDHNIDVLAWNAGGIDTNMARDAGV